MEAIGDFLGDIKDAVGNFISNDEVKNIANQVTSTLKENVTKENLSSWVEKIKSGVEKVANQEDIKKIFEYAKKQVGVKTGQTGKVIQCLEKDIKDTSCLGHFTESSAFSIQGANLFATVVCGLFILFLINFAFGRRL